MKTKSIIILLSFFFMSCGVGKTSKQSFTLYIFSNLEKNKCIKGENDRFLLQSGYFESIGSKNGVNTFTTFSKFEIVLVNTFDYSNGYLLLTKKTDVYNFIKRNGEFIGSKKGSRGFTWLIYKLYNSEYLLRIEENYIANRNVRYYNVYSSCN